MTIPKKSNPAAVQNKEILDDTSNLTIEEMFATAKMYLEMCNVAENRKENLKLANDWFKKAQKTGEVSCCHIAEQYLTAYKQIKKIKRFLKFVDQWFIEAQKAGEISHQDVAEKFLEEYEKDKKTTKYLDYASYWFVDAQEAGKMSHQEIAEKYLDIYKKVTNRNYLEEANYWLKEAVKVGEMTYRDVAEKYFEVYKTEANKNYLIEASSWFVEALEAGEISYQSVTKKFLDAYENYNDLNYLFEVVPWFEIPIIDGQMTYSDAIDKYIDIDTDLAPIVTFFYDWCDEAVKKGEISYEDIVEKYLKIIDKNKEKCAQLIIYALLEMEKAGGKSAEDWLIQVAESGDINRIDAVKTFLESVDAYIWEEVDDFKICFYEKIAQKGDVNAQYMLATTYSELYSDLGEESDLEGAVYWHTKAAEQGNKDSAYQIQITINSANDLIDELFKFDEGIRYLRSLAKAGYVQEQSQLAYHLEQQYYFSNFEEPEYLEEAIYWYTKLAEDDEEYAHKLAILYEFKSKDPVLKEDTDIEKAFFWNKKALSKNFCDAQFFLAEMYRKGKGVKKNLSKAVDWYRKAADQDCIHAQYALAEMYRNGNEIEKNLEDAIKWYEMVAEHDFEYFEIPAIYSVTAQFILAEMYMNGEGVKKNLGIAKKWLKKAEEYAKYAFKFSKKYSQGIGVKRDFMQAVYWKTIAETYENLKKI